MKMHLIILSILIVGSSALPKVEVTFGNDYFLKDEAIPVTHTDQVQVHLNKLEITYVDEMENAIQTEKMLFRDKRDSGLPDNCRDNWRIRINNMTCGGFFVAVGKQFCDHTEVKKHCCSTRHRHCVDCSDTANAKISVPGVKPMTCNQFLATTGVIFCNDGNVRSHCCSSRRSYCHTCFGDSQGVRLNGKTCEGVISSDREKMCTNPSVIQHCCASRAHFCPCQGDIHGTLLHWNGNIVNCNNVFQLAGDKGCQYPNLWQQCCETRENFCDDPPPLVGPDILVGG